ncbi:PREDICTED: serine/threonine-protein phosphatase 7 long form homolog [Tarenaya hassleriana]|uniref:serine/threonine-protein phosphatase 7 long form homolog n=1 Tax=Tarenaya hassleriana TaxID=28532 RepID=UPI00053C43BA|nr:PREDICTED: serine/threonine-protein phosphatase 7 long form homolog [Tarenaya hassleriana]XP_010519613.1 PREDICTED: serine/threonine-protein phosphatase 7 long form homolog [Tarenaya hassleriana]XP_010519615.1 PREDICTED: serine/threonine-protein phosphatase 7 long form homolog [Tarenaya hassleriana]
MMENGVGAVVNTELEKHGFSTTSVLYEQDKHVSSAILTGQERGVLRCQERTSLLHHWKLTQEQIDLVDKAGFGYFRLIGSISLNNSLISALVERWRRETNTFHFPCGEMTITLDEVSLILGLAIDGEPVLGVKDKDEEPAQVCKRLLGKSPRGELSGNRVTAKWLKENFSECPKGASMKELEYHTRAYLVYLVGSTIFATTDPSKISVDYLLFFEDFEKAGKYAWGAAALAFLYRQIGNASQRSQSIIGGCLTLLQCWSYFHLDIDRPKRTPHQFPLALLWKGRQQSRSKNDLFKYRKALDDLDPSHVSWCPYGGDLDIVRTSFKDSIILGRSRTRLIGPKVVEWHFPDRCMRQFGMCQFIPGEVPPRKNDKTNHEEDLVEDVNTAREEWMRRRENIVQNLGGDTDENEYMQWFSTITVPKLHRDTTLEADIMNVQATILQFDEVASALSLDELHPEDRELIEAAVITMSNALRVGDWYDAFTGNSNSTKRKRRDERTPPIEEAEWSE